MLKTVQTLSPEKEVMLVALCLYLINNDLISHFDMETETLISDYFEYE